MNVVGRAAHRALALLVAALLALPVAGAAQQGQQHRHGQQQEAQGGQMRGMMGMQQGQMMGMHGPMMGMMGMMAGPSPAMILQQREALELTAEQVQELEALEERLAKARAGHMESMQTLHQRLAEQAQGPDLDLEAYESSLRSLADEQIAMQMAMARAGQEAREVLTAEQREKLRIGMQFMRGSMMQMMRGRVEGMGSGGMGSMMGGMMMGGMSCPMMGESGGSNP